MKNALDRGRLTQAMSGHLGGGIPSVAHTYWNFALPIGRSSVQSNGSGQAEIEPSALVKRRNRNPTQRDLSSDGKSRTLTVPNCCA